MWVCPTCGEPHQDQFKECWKCVGAEMESDGAEPDPQSAAPTPSERPLRSVGAIAFRITVGFGVGMLAGMAVFHRYGASLAQAATLGAILGTIVGVIVGVLLWVVFPFQPTATPTEPPDSKE